MPADTLDIEEGSRSVSADRAGAVLENSIEVKPGSLTPELVIWRSVYLAFFSATVFTFGADAITSGPLVDYHQVELSWPLRTVLAEMPRLITSMRSVFHGRVAFRFLSSPTRKVYFAASLSQGVGKVFSDAEIIRLIRNQ